MDAETIFKALADEHRRALLDMLFERDGQTLSQLEAPFAMTRFGVMKHLQILEDAGLVTTRKVGREKFHYLNPMPIQLVYDRWVSKYAQPFTQQLAELKHVLEGESMSQYPTHIQQLYIKTTPERLWQALTQGEFTRQYYFGTHFDSALQPGAAYRYAYANGVTMLEGEILEIDPPRKMVMSFYPRWSGEETGNQRSVVTYEIEPKGDVCKLTLSHAGLDPAQPLTAGMIDGWAEILSGLKTLLETGDPLRTTG
ncbi:MAG: metalloregulator ArsR/SmtB family transcription factor [bacterium]|nr:metalloregulator ArsR/SmtB family transcription factor [bacterium]